MIGDKIIPKAHHRRAARQILSILSDRVKGRRAALAVAGESGSGKSEIAYELVRGFEENGLKVFVFQQDDYFLLPPKTNHQRRLESIGHVGPQEVNLALLDRHIDLFKNEPEKAIEKPLVIFDEDRISHEIIEPARYSLAIAEGTYTLLLANVDYRIFLARTYKETAAARRERARDKVDAFSEKVLAIEHGIISQHSRLATIVVDRDYQVSVVSI